jgi:hypothetical protein
MNRLPDVPAGGFRLPAGTVVHHGSGLESADDVKARGLHPRKPAGPLGNWRAAAEDKILRQPAAIYVVRGEVREAVPWAAVAAGVDGTPCVWKLDAGGLIAMADLAYPELPNVLRLVSHVRPARLLELYDCSRDPCVSVWLANGPQTAL